MAARYLCGIEGRRAAVRAHATLDGIDHLEVLDGEAPEPLRQRLLVVRLLKGAAAGLSADNVRIDGGVRVRPIVVRWALPLPEVAGAPESPVTAAEKGFLAGHFAGEPAPETVFVVRVEETGDFSTYRLALVDPQTGEPPAADDLDPRLSAVDFSFKVECPSPFDCADDCDCPPPALAEPELDLLAKDYASFRRLILDRLATLAPGWRDRSPADLGVALVELAAYVGDQLSYFQDAVATEAYLGTARRRVSVRRHVRLTDYRLHEGTNARTWVAVQTGAGAGGATLPGPDAAAGTPGTAFLTRTAAAGGGAVVVAPDRRREVLRSGPVVFESLAGLTLLAALDEIEIHTWSDEACCLPAGATRATLRGPLPLRAGRSPLLQGPAHDDPGGEPGLGEGDFLLFEEVVGPETHAAADADPTHRHVVRLLSAVAATDPVDGQAVVEVTWGEADALPFPLCVSVLDAEDREVRVSLARGNVVPADHGLSGPEPPGPPLGPVPGGEAPFRPELDAAPLVHAAPLAAGFFPDPAGAAAPLPAAALADADPRAALPALRLEEPGGARWRPRHDLLESGAFARELVVEMDDERRATLRFGDGFHGRRPAAGTTFTSSFRLGGGTAGNVGAGALSRVIAPLPGIVSVRNPLAATGGRDPEPVEDARQYAPQAFRTQLRAVTEEDYARAAERHPEVQRAAATFRWTGSWTTVFVTVDRRGGGEVDDDFEAALRRHLDVFRMTGRDLEIDGPRFVPLDVELDVCVGRDHRRADVLRELLRVFSAGCPGDGGGGFFHPDAWTFGQPVYLSRLVAAASRVPGVASVAPRCFQRWGRPATGELDAGVIPLGRLEIARLANDPNLPEGGRLVFAMAGGA